ncbi:hypothetical protein [Leisingera sp. ANG-M6]|uniref:hypothetical protein n=1 Tax=Leisingera sp. ANG-M6 TaxID=1577900 RepID=UPI0005809018|nr:hypothetical protein [Leisingera sp. ANG-M6]KIC27572.1 hypothetical protein RA24_12750 [Leisingera sp. ANG-M6]
MSGRKIKEFEEYLVDGGTSHIDLADYLHSPASAFLKYTIEAKSAVDLCTRHFPKKADGSYSKASLDSLEHIVSAMLPALMGHFETYQRYLFAGLFDYSIFIGGFDVSAFLKRLSKETNIEIDLSRLAAHRGIGAKSIGVLLADSMTGWHDPARVNSYFDAFGIKRQFFSNKDCKRLAVLWQLRHSISHTGGTLTLADAQKVEALKAKGNANIVFEKNFVFEVARKLHPLVQEATHRLRDGVLPRLIPETPEEEKMRIEEFFKVHSSVAVWLA